MAYPVMQYPDGRVKMSDGTIQEASNTFHAGSPASVIQNDAPISNQIAPEVSSHGQSTDLPGFLNPIKNLPINIESQQGIDNVNTPENQTQQSDNSNQAQPPEMIIDAGKAILSGMPIKEFDKYYPEMAGMDKTVFNQLAYDVEQGSSPDEIVKAYPEIFGELSNQMQQSQNQNTQLDPNSLGNQNNQEQPFLQDQHSNEGIIEQGLKALPRALLDTVQGIIGGAETVARGFNNTLAKTVGDYGIYPVLNAIGYAIKGNDYQPMSSIDTLMNKNSISNSIGAGKEALLGEKTFSQVYNEANQADQQRNEGQSLMSDVTDITKGVSQAAFNEFKAPLATGLNIASELPGSQYIMEGISKAIEGTGKGIADITGVDENTMQNIIQTGMNVLGLKAPGAGTIDSFGKAKTAFESAPDIKSGTLGATKSVAGDIGVSAYDAVKWPIDIIKDTVKVPEAVNKFVDQYITGLDKSKIAGLQSNPYIKSLWGDTVEKINSAEGIPDIKQVQTEYTGKIADELQAKIEAKKEQLSENGPIYAQIKELPIEISIKPTLDKFMETLNKSGLILDEGVIKPDGSMKSSHFTDTDVSNINKFLNSFIYDSKQGKMTPDVILEGRALTRKFARYDVTKTTEGMSLFQQFRRDINETVRPQIPGLENIDKNYADKLDSLQEAQDGLIYKAGDKKGQFKDNFDSIIKNILTDRNSALRERLQEVMPDLSAKMEAVGQLKGLYDSYTKENKLFRYATGGAGAIGGFVTGGPLGALKGWLLGTAVEKGTKALKQRSIDKIINNISDEGKTRLESINEQINNNSDLEAKDKTFLADLKLKIEKDSQSIKTKIVESRNKESGLNNAGKAEKSNTTQDNTNKSDPLQDLYDVGNSDSQNIIIDAPPKKEVNDKKDTSSKFKNQTIKEKIVKSRNNVDKSEITNNKTDMDETNPKVNSIQDLTPKLFGTDNEKIPATVQERLVRSRVGYDANSGYSKKPLSGKTLEKISSLDKYNEKMAENNANYISRNGRSNFDNLIKLQYIKEVKNYISKGYNIPNKVIDQFPEFSKAIDARARYEKGLYTSFSNKDNRIDYSTKDQIGGGVKRQDGNTIEPNQIKEITDGVKQFSDALGLDVKKLAEEENIVFVHLNGKNAFLKNNVSGMYRKSGEQVSVSVGGTESARQTVRGKVLTEKVHTTMSHELGHALDHFKGGNGRMFYDLMWDSNTRKYNPVEELHKYYRKPEEITARLIEEYVEVKKGQDNYYDKPGYWSKEIFDKISPKIQEIIDKKFSDYKL